MRHLFALGLAICVAGSAAAQTEVIIRRPGQQDQVTSLDSARTREALAKVQAELQKATTAMAGRLAILRRDLSHQAAFEQSMRVSMLALKDAEIAAQRWPEPMASSWARRQPHLGILVATTPRETDKYGAYISAVTPGSPADKAGIISGDIIVRIAGKSLVDKDPKDDSGPGVRLISIIGTLTVGKPVDVELRRGTQNKTVKVTPNEDEGVIARMAPSIVEFPRASGGRFNGSIAFGGEIPTRAAVPGFNLFTGPNGTYGYAFGNNGLFASYELAPLNDKLGAYFGATEGVLVVNTSAGRSDFMDAVPATARTSRDSGARGGGMTCDSITGTPGSTIRCRGTAGTTMTYLDGVPAQPGVWARRPTPATIGLEPGDVIVSVDGRKVTNPSQLMRIVGSYDHNDQFKLQIMRQKRAETLTVKMP